MNPADDREEAFFREALHRPKGPDRDAFLNQACAGNPVLRSRLEAQAVPPGNTTVQVPIKEGPGTLIGRSKRLKQVGEGGFGVVYVAEQREPVKRRVALKIIKLGMDARQVAARFEAEPQALALMDHPNIAEVLDGGATDTGRPYFVTELVKGIQIIHRDIKPSSILVTLHDGVPVPKVIDFGIAKATQAELTEKTVYMRQTHLELQTLRGHSGNVVRVAFSLDGQRTVTGSCDRTARVWEAASGNGLLILRGHSGAAEVAEWGSGVRSDRRIDLHLDKGCALGALHKRTRRTGLCSVRSVSFVQLIRSSSWLIGAAPPSGNPR